MMRMTVAKAEGFIMGIIAGFILLYVPAKLGDTLLRLFPCSVKEMLGEVYGYDPGK